MTATLIHCWWEGKKCWPTLENHLAVSDKINHTLITYDPEIPHLGIYPREMKTYINTENYTQLCIASLFVVSPTGSNPNLLQLENIRTNCSTSKPWNTT